MNIHILVIPNYQHRPDITGADWYFDQSGDMQIRISKMSDWRYEFALAVHEMVEAGLCKHNGVTQQMVDEFDIPYEKSHTKKCNAGDEPDAPYQKEHCLATAAERIVASELGLDWLAYDQELEAF